MTWRVYTTTEIEDARRDLTRRFRVDITDYEAVWSLRDTYEPGWRDRRDRPADKIVHCLTSIPTSEAGT